jgi:hypothetical protein
VIAGEDIAELFDFERDGCAKRERFATQRTVSVPGEERFRAGPTTSLPVGARGRSDECKRAPCGFLIREFGAASKVPDSIPLES